MVSMLLQNNMDIRDIKEIRNRWPKKCFVEHQKYGLGDVVNVDTKHKLINGKVDEVIVMDVWFDNGQVVSFDDLENTFMILLSEDEYYDYSCDTKYSSG